MAPGWFAPIILFSHLKAWNCRILIGFQAHKQNDMMEVMKQYEVDIYVRMRTWS